MKKNKLILGILALTVATALVAGCSSGGKPAAQPQNNQQQASGHEGHSNAMPKEDPMPMMKDMDKDLQDMIKQVKAGQTMEAQKSASRMMGTVDKVTIHMMDNELKDNLRKAAADIKDSVNSGKADPAALEGKLKAMQDIMKQTTTHLQSMSH